MMSTKKSFKTSAQKRNKDRAIKLANSRRVQHLSQEKAQKPLWRP